MKSEKVILVIRCADCGAELNRSPRPLSKREASIARVSSGIAGSKCPNGCRSTLSDLNLNTRLEEIPA